MWVYLNGDLSQIQLALFVHGFCIHNQCGSKVQYLQDLKPADTESQLFVYPDSMGSNVGLEYAWILVSLGRPGTNSPCILGNDCSLILYII